MIEDHPVLFLQGGSRRILDPRSETLGQLVLFVLGQGDDQRRMFLVPLRQRSSKIAGYWQINLAADGRGEGVDEAVVIAHRNGIELVIVAARAADRHAEHRGARGVGHVIEFIVARGFKFLFRQLRGEHARTKEAGSLHRERVVRCKLIAGQLPFHELIVRHVGVERLNDEVAVMEGEIAIVILLEPVALCKARHIEPMSAPTLTVFRRGQQTVDDLFQCSIRIAGC